MARTTFLFVIFFTSSLINYVSAQFDVLVFSKTTGFRHASIADGIEALTQLGQANDFRTYFTENAEDFCCNQLDTIEVIVFLNTTGDVLNESEQAAMESFIQSGKGFVGIHSASDTEYNWAWYGNLVGRYFAGHPAVQEASLNLEATDHPAVAELPASFTRNDEWYNFAIPFPENLQVLISVDETSYTGGNMGAYHPISWYHEYDGGRAFYTAMGHTRASYQEQIMQDHILGAIQWAAGERVTSAPERFGMQVVCYPNPGSDNLTLSAANQHIVAEEVVVRNAMGKEVLRQSNVPLPFTFPISDWQAGLYLVQTTTPQHIFLSRIVVK